MKFEIEILGFDGTENKKITADFKSEIKTKIRKEFPGITRIILKETVNGYYATEGHGDPLAIITEVESDEV